MQLDFIIIYRKETFDDFLLRFFHVWWFNYFNCTITKQADLAAAKTK